MKQLTCEMCGSTELLKQDGVFVCQTCGTKYSVEDAKKMMVEGVVEIQGSVKVDNTSKLENYLELADDAWEMAEDDEKAIEYCDKALEIDPENPTAWIIKSSALLNLAVKAGVKSKAKLFKQGCSALRNAALYKDNDNMYNNSIAPDFLEYVVESCGELFAKNSAQDTIKCAEECFSDAIFTYSSIWCKQETETDENISTTNIESNKELHFKYKCMKQMLYKFSMSFFDIHSEYTRTYSQYNADWSNPYSAPKQANNPYIYQYSLYMDFCDYLVRQFKTDELEYIECKKLVKEIYEEKAFICNKYNNCIHHSAGKKTYTCKEGTFDVIDTNSIYAKIKKIDSTYKTQEEIKSEIKLNTINNTSSNIKSNPTTTTSSGGCYVATCVYGSYDCPQVWTLRRFRDDTLGSTWYGRLFIRTYYAISPTLVKWFGNTNWFKKLWKGKLDRMVAKLQSNGVEDTPYEDKNW